MHKTCMHLECAITKNANTIVAIFDPLFWLFFLKRTGGEWKCDNSLALLLSDIFTFAGYNVGASDIIARPERCFSNLRLCALATLYIERYHSCVSTCIVLMCIISYRFNTRINIHTQSHKHASKHARAHKHKNGHAPTNEHVETKNSCVYSVTNRETFCSALTNQPVAIDIPKLITKVS